MSELQIRFRNARREPLDDTLDVRVVAQATNRLVGFKRGVSGRSRFVVPDLNPGQHYVVSGFPHRHRPVGHIVQVPIDGPAKLDMHFPLHPDHCEPSFKPYRDLDGELRAVLESSTLESTTATGADLYNGLQDIERAGLLESVLQDAGVRIRRAAQRLESGRRSLPRPAGPDLRRRGRGAEGPGEDRRGRRAISRGERPASHPAARVPQCRIVQDRRAIRQLQLSFFASEAAPLRFKVDADIDDAAGVAHTFQVLRNRITEGTTHPYDIHQILVFRQEAFPPYDLA